MRTVTELLTPESLVAPILRLNQNPQTSGDNDFYAYAGVAGDFTGSGGNNANPDGNPQNVDPQFLAGTCYRIASGSPVLDSPIDFPQIAGHWGPPNFPAAYRVPAATQPPSYAGPSCP